MKRTRIVLFSVSAGAGHVRAAQAIQAGAKLWHPELKVVHIDFMDLVPAAFRKVYVDSYLALVERHPGLWGYIYDKTDRQRFDSTFNRIRRTVERLCTLGLQRILDKIKPDHVICTHFLPAQCMSRKINSGQYAGSLWVQITDFDLHALWLHQHVSGYFVASEEMAWRMTKRGVSAAMTHATGIPVMPAFENSYDHATCAAEFGLDPRRQVLLMTGGGTGIGPCDRLAEALLDEVEHDYQLVVLAGRNCKLLEKLQTLALRYPSRLFAVGYTTVIERLFAVADLVITKPGGLTTSECLTMGLPMVLISPIPGQEEHNADFLLNAGAAMKAGDPQSLAWCVRQLLGDRSRRDAIRDRGKAIVRRDVARTVLNTVVNGSKEFI